MDDVILSDPQVFSQNKSTSKNVMIVNDYLGVTPSIWPNWSLTKAINLHQYSEGFIPNGNIQCTPSPITDVAFVLPAQISTLSASRCRQLNRTAWCNYLSKFPSTSLPQEVFYVEDGAALLDQRGHGSKGIVSAMTKLGYSTHVWSCSASQFRAPVDQNHMILRFSRRDSEQKLVLPIHHLPGRAMRPALVPYGLIPHKDKNLSRPKHVFQDTDLMPNRIGSSVH